MVKNVCNRDVIDVDVVNAAINPYSSLTTRFNRGIKDSDIMRRACARIPVPQIYGIPMVTAARKIAVEEVKVLKSQMMASLQVTCIVII
jgi:hypothetical protein